MKLTNQELINAFNCIKEVLESKEAKQNAPESGKVIYAFAKMRNKFAKLIDEFNKQQQGIMEATQQAITGLDEAAKKEILKTANQDFNDLLSKEVELDFDIHKIQMDSAEVIQKYLTESATLGLFNTLTQE